VRLQYWTPIVFLAPERYVAEGDHFAEVPLRAWSEAGYTYDPDPWQGWNDFLTPPEEMLSMNAEGDCEDYAFLAASVLASRGVSPIDIVFLTAEDGVGGHVLCATEARVFSSGDVFNRPLREWLPETRWTLPIRRRVR